MDFKHVEITVDKKKTCIVVDGKPLENCVHARIDLECNSYPFLYLVIKPEKLTVNGDFQHYEIETDDGI